MIYDLSVSGFFHLCFQGLFHVVAYVGFPGSSAGKESTCNAGDPGLIPGSGRSLGEGKCYPLQYSGLENAMNCIVHGVTKKSDMTEQLSFKLFTF